MKFSGIITSLNFSANFYLIITYNMYILPFLIDQWNLHCLYYFTFNKLNRKLFLYNNIFLFVCIFSWLNAGLHVSAIILVVLWLLLFFYCCSSAVVSIFPPPWYLWFLYIESFRPSILFAYFSNIAMSFVSYSLSDFNLSLMKMLTKT